MYDLREDWRTLDRTMHPNVGPSIYEFCLHGAAVSNKQCYSVTVFTVQTKVNIWDEAPNSGV